jgi:mannose-6-phosphate isomerase
LVGPESRILNGPQAGWTVAQLSERYGEALLGAAATARYGRRFPLLIKLLDAAQPLSIQVHPDDAYAARHANASGDLGKTEAWWVLAAAPDSFVWWGVNETLSRERLRALLTNGELSAHLRRIPVVAGQVVVNPAGTIHALGAGVLAYEVQQASDLTYRLDDHGRRDAAGLPRTLHLEDGLAVANLEPGGASAPVPRVHGPGRVELARTHAFVLDRLDPGASDLEVVLGAGSVEILTNLGSQPGVATGGSAAESLELPPGSSWLYPAGSGTIRLSGGGPYARARYPSRAPQAGEG